MSVISTLIGVGVGAIAIIPAFFVNSKWIRSIVVVTALSMALVTVQLSTAYLYPYYLSWQFEHQLKAYPLFELIAEKHPKEFAQFITKVRYNLRENHDASLISVYSTELVNAIFFQHLKSAPDDAINQYLKATIELYHYLYTQDPRAVIKLEKGDETVPFDFNTLMEDKTFQVLLNNLLEAKKEVIEASIKSPVAVPTEEISAPLLQKVLNELASKYGENIVKLMYIPPQANVPPGVIAQLFIHFYTGIVGAGKENAGLMMRHIASLKEESQLKQELKQRAHR